MMHTGLSALVQVREGQQQLVTMAEKLEKKRWKKDELKAAFVRDHEERFRMQYRQQQLELQSRVQVCAPPARASHLPAHSLLLRAPPEAPPCQTGRALSSAV